MEGSVDYSAVSDPSHPQQTQDMEAPISSSSTHQKSALQHNIESKGTNAYYYAHSKKPNGPVWDGKPEPRLLSKSSNTSSFSSFLGGTEEEDGCEQSESVRNRTTLEQTSFRSTSFDSSKNTISKYAFLDEGSKVRIYIDLTGVGEKCSDEDVKLEYTESSFCLRVSNYYDGDASGEENNLVMRKDECLGFARLAGLIDKATVKKKKDRLVVTLVKKKKSPKMDQDAKDETEENDDEVMEEEENMYDEWFTIGAQGIPDHELL